MKKILSLLFVGFLFSGSFAQDLTFPNWKDTVNGTTDDWEIDSHQMDVVNTSGQSLSLRVEKNIVTSVNTTEYYFCWGPTCQDADDTLSSETVVIADGDTNTTFINYCRIKSDQANSGVSRVEYCFFETGGVVPDICIDQYFDVEYISGIETGTKLNSDFKILTSVNLMTINMGQNYDNLQVTVFDTNGRLVKSESGLNTDQVNVATEGLSSGGYVVKVQNGSDFVGAKKIVLLQ